MWRIFLLLWVAMPALAIDTFSFDNAQQQQRFQKLSEELRCLVCQNQSLADSNAELALDLRKKVYDRVIAGQTDEQIKTYLLDRYGDFVLYKPTVKPVTYVLWFGPLGLLLLALFILYRVARRKPEADPSDDVAANQRTIKQMIDEVSKPE